ncbi:nucleotidyltransferase family protein [Methylobacter sp. YRD-M1]|uniref:nucleotidyltransferase family protein n=1 Tax=Methylobacter sp. YRD-M1 TaxID=2911520 RepID=UPI00227AD661|nr:nucleotidyltransferase family protein [Methylobacter sp. YRD-M1]WAK00497.1 nucleotidyltransferase family protein [Methylobacter sp. YRD-M1]
MPKLICLNGQHDEYPGADPTKPPFKIIFKLMDPIIGILLAAGASRRFGADKLTHILPDGGQIAVHACRNLLAGTDGVLAVVRPGSEELAARLQAEGAEVRICADAEQGMGMSLAFGIRARPEAAGWLVALADMPWIMPATIRRVADEIRLGTLIAAPCWQGQRGHPVGFSQVLGPDLAALNGDAGAKSVVQAHLEQLCLVDCNDPGVLRDIDKPQDLEILTKN